MRPMATILLGTRSMVVVKVPRTRGIRMRGKVGHLEGPVIDPAGCAPYNLRDGPRSQPWSATARLCACGAEGPVVPCVGAGDPVARGIAGGRGGGEDHDRVRWLGRGGEH